MNSRRSLTTSSNGAANAAEMTSTSRSLPTPAKRAISYSTFPPCLRTGRRRHHRRDPVARSHCQRPVRRLPPWQQEHRAVVGHVPAGAVNTTRTTGCPHRTDELLEKFMRSLRPVPQVRRRRVRCDGIAVAMHQPSWATPSCARRDRATSLSSPQALPVPPVPCLFQAANF